MRRRPLGASGASRGKSGGSAPRARFLLSIFPFLGALVETRLLILNADPVFQDRALSIFDEIDGIETRVVRRLPEAVSVLLAENFDGFVVEGEAAIALEQATNARQHFPSLNIMCLAPKPHDEEFVSVAHQQKIMRVATSGSEREPAQAIARVCAFARSRRNTRRRDRSLPLAHRQSQPVFRCRNLADELSGPAQRSVYLQIGPGNSEIYLAHGSVRHAVFGSLEGESAVAEIFRWRQGRFYFEEGIISQVQTVDRPWAHLLIDNLQKLDETLELSATGPA